MAQNHCHFHLKKQTRGRLTYHRWLIWQFESVFVLIAVRCFNTMSAEYESRVAKLPLVSPKRAHKKQGSFSRLDVRFFSGFVFILVPLCPCRGFIALDNRTFIIEPASGRDNDAHLIYRVEKLALTQGDCGHGFNISSIAAENHIRNPFQSFRTRVRLQWFGFFFSTSLSGSILGYSKLDLFCNFIKLWVFLGFSAKCLCTTGR